MIGKLNLMSKKGFNYLSKYVNSFKTIFSNQSVSYKNQRQQQQQKQTEQQQQQQQIYGL